MRLGILLALLPFFALSSGLHQDQACGTVPGESAVPHSVGNFTFPNGNTPTFSSGTSMNISWTTTFQFSTLWLITGCDFANPTKSLVAGLSATYHVWNVETDATNSSQLYSFRVVNAIGSSADQMGGGFWSAVFYISGGDTTILSLKTSMSSRPFTITTLASETSPITQTNSALSSPTTSSLPMGPSGLSTGAKTGVGVGVSLSILGLAGFAICLYFWRKHHDKKQGSQAPDDSITRESCAPQHSPYHDHYTVKETPAVELYAPSSPQLRPMYELGEVERYEALSQDIPPK